MIKRSTTSRRRSAPRSRVAIVRTQTPATKTWQAIVLTVAMTMQGFAFPFTAVHAEEVSNESVFANMDGFQLTDPYTDTNPDGFFSSDTIDGDDGFFDSDEAYPEAACIPILASITNETNDSDSDDSNDDIDLNFWFEYKRNGSAAGAIGVDHLEALTTALNGNVVQNANELNDFTFPGTGFSTMTSFKTSNNQTVVAAVTGPFGGQSGTAAVASNDEYRHYNVALTDIGNRTAHVLFCARLGSDARSYDGSSSDEIDLGVLGVDTDDDGSNDSASDDDVRIDQDELVDIASAPQTGTLVVTKAVTNDNGGAKVISNFSLFVGTTAVTSGQVNTLNAGTYTVSETADSAYAASFSGDCNASGQVTVTAGATSTCTITNDDIPAKIKIVKTVENTYGGLKGADDFTYRLDGTIVSHDVDIIVTPGVPHSVVEDADPGYDALYGADCAGGQSMTVLNGETKICTIVNRDKPATLTVIKQVVNDNGGSLEADDFSMHVAGTDVSDADFSGSTEGVTITLDAGSYEVTETNVPTYLGTYGEGCSGTIANGETKTCTITNNDRPATLRVIKQVVNNNAGEAVASDFRMRVIGTDASPSVFQGDEAGTIVTLDAGSFSVGEDQLAGYTAFTSGVCSGALGLGESVTCTYINDDIAPDPVPTGYLTVIKVVNNENGGTLEPQHFSLNVSNGENPLVQNVPGAGAPGTIVQLTPGNYSVTEAQTEAIEGYEVSYSEDCSGTIADGEGKTCTVTNTAKLATLTVIKAWVADDGGSVGEAALFVNGTPVTSGVAATHTAGTYTVSETSIPGWAMSFSGACNDEGVVTLSIGEEAVCEVTNNDIAPTLTVIKQVVNDNGGTLNAGDFTLLVSQGDGAPQRVQGTSSTGVTLTLNAGSFNVDESAFVRDGETGNDTATPHGYAMTRSSGLTEGEGDDSQQQQVEEYCTGELELGEHVTCVITNNDPEITNGILIVKKHVINDGTGTFGAIEFLLTLTTTVTVKGEEGPETETHTQLFRGSEAGEVFSALAPGTTYTVTESPFQAWVNAFGVLGPTEQSHGYTSSMSENCFGTIVAGQTVVCTITNDDPGSTPPENGGGGGGGGGAATNPQTSGLGSTGNVTTPGRVLGIEDVPETSTTIDVCRAEDPDAVLLTLETEAMLQKLGLSRDTQGEQSLDSSLVPRVLPDGTSVTDRARVRDFTVYGPKALRRLGAGERAGVIASYVLIYKRLPKTECDWQNVLRIAHGSVPVVLSPEREKAVETDFTRIYGRAPDRVQEKDNATILIMAYGLRPVNRSLPMERRAIRIFRAIFTHVPRITHEWDVMRGIAYGGLTVPGFAAIVR